ncbi:MAG: hypothetical protein HOJ21_04465 [Alphaproteobacteria bacterium]|jgi:hypothetical protein|nr:hypothetical protein [Alphaproteobacteria bacterium]
MPADTSPPLMRLTAAECRWNGPIPPGARAWAMLAPNFTDRPYGDLAQRLRTAMAVRRHMLPGQKSALQDQPLAAATSQLLQWRTQAVAKLAASR